MKCNLCPRRCNVDRSVSPGYCGAGDKIKIARAAPHFWEEPCISGKNGSGTVFFSGCSLRCVFCQNYNLSHCAYGEEITDIQLIRVFDKLVAQGVHNLNLVTPTHYADRLAGILADYHSPVPVVWNSGGYESVETLKRLEGLVDVYLPDIKYFDSTVAQKYSSAGDYFEKAADSILEMYKQVGGLITDGSGMAKKGLIIRHLVLPGNVSQSRKIIGWVEENLPNDIGFSLMRQYIPYGKAKEMPPLDRKLSNREYNMAKDCLLDTQIENIFLQSAKSATEEFIPNFDIKALDLSIL